MTRVPLKPISINRAYNGRMKATDALKAFKLNCRMLLPPSPGCDVSGRIRISFLFGFSNPAQDIDSPIKACQDALESKYGFNDRQVYELAARKVVVKKGDEFWGFQIEKIN